MPNELTAECVIRLGRAIGQTLWSTAGSTFDDAVLSNGVPSVRRRAPTVVIGLDARPMSPRLATQVVRGLRETGTHVLDAGRISRPMLEWAVEQRHADAGVFVTGAGAPHPCGGLDIVSATGVAWSRGSRLDELQRALENPASRPSRSGGGYEVLDVESPYVGSLSPLLHGLRPLHLAISTADAMASAVLNDLLKESPVRMRPVAEAALAGELRRGEFDLGVAISEDGTAARVLDERGESLDTLALVRHLANAMLDEWSHVSIAVAADLYGQVEKQPHADDGEFILHHDGGPTQHSLVTTMHAVGAQLGCDSAGRVWLRENGTRSDALVTLLHLLALLSRRAEPASWIRRSPRSSIPNAESGSALHALRGQATLHANDRRAS